MGTKRPKKSYSKSRLTRESRKVSPVEASVPSGKGYPTQSLQDNSESIADGFEGVTEAFRDLLEGAEIMKLDPDVCIPFSKVRSISPSGVSRLKESFSGHIEDDGMTKGITSGGCLPSVVRLEGVYESFPYSFLESNFLADGLSANEATKKAEEMVKKHDVWYGIIDGAHRHMAISELMKDSPNRWAGFQWTVMVIQSASKSILRAYARNANEKQKKDYVVACTFYDTLCAFKDEAKEIEACTGQMPSAVEVAGKVAGGKKWSSATTVQLARTALRLPNEVLEEIGAIVNSEHPEIASGFHQKSPRNGSTPDCRIYRNIFSSSSLKQATSFMRCKNTTDAIHALRRARYHASLNYYKPVSYKVIEKEFKAAVAARLEAEKFELFLGGKGKNGLLNLKQPV